MGGEDGGEALCGTSGAGARGYLIVGRGGRERVLKGGGGGAEVGTRRGVFYEGALPADVVDPTGAGDAFAAGYLAGCLFGWDAQARLRLGHVLGSRVVGVIEDVPPPLTAEELAELLPESLTDRWRRLAR